MTCFAIVHLCWETEGWWRWVLVSLDGVAPSQIVCVCLCESCSIKSRSSLLAPVYPGGPGKRAVKWFCVCMCVCWETERMFWIQLNVWHAKRTGHSSISVKWLIATDCLYPHLPHCLYHITAITAVSILQLLSHCTSMRYWSRNKILPMQVEYVTLKTDTQMVTIITTNKNWN